MEENHYNYEKNVFLFLSSTLILFLSALAKPHSEKQRSVAEPAGCELAGEDHRRLHAGSHGVRVSTSADGTTRQSTQQEATSSH